MMHLPSTYLDRGTAKTLIGKKNPRLQSQRNVKLGTRIECRTRIVVGTERIARVGDGERGLEVGVIYKSVPLYQRELAEKERRLEVREAGG